jgi:hypothetical protein
VEVSTFIGFPWEVTLESENEVTISNIEVESHLSEECKKYGLPLTSVASGTVKGKFSGYVPEKEGHDETQTTFVFDEVSGLSINEVPAKLNGFLSFGTKLTAEFIEI